MAALTLDRMYDMEDYELIQKLGSLGIRFVQTGSKYICNPPVLNTDADFVIFDTSKFNPGNNGFFLTNQSDEYGSTDFDTYRNGDINLIVVKNYQEFRKWEVATAAAKQLNIKDKQKRIQLFQGVLYGNW